MKTTFISTVTLWKSPRSSLDRLQESLTKANTELTTGRHADVGLALGYKVGESLSLRQQRAEIDTLTDSNGLAIQRLKTTTSALDGIRESATKFRDALVGLPANPPVETIKSQAEAYMSSLIGNLNVSIGGQYIFGGINTKAAPANDYAGGSPLSLKGAVATTFSAPAASGGFGFAQTNPLASGITPGDMRTFLDGPFKQIFEGAGWNTLSNASDQNIQSLISPTEKVETSTNASSTPMRQIAMAYTMVFDLGIESLNPEARNVVFTKAIEVLSSAISGLINVQARIGTAQARTETAIQRMDLQKSIFDERIGGLEAVDPTEAKVRVDQLMTQIQTSYSLTAQLKQLSLINYL
ncbi:flagellar hook-associated family protein [Microvirga tunisiensis]|uniref:Flagellin n=1 Tax=Microvirga tunisiensis TaxID=2108360 RepID=A0A5N7MPV2_9HYPH|nr:flagellar hook-associated family protein [Microvirga tunisiensis]MPR10722.1 flagellar hook-associated family protein [Microvirga tunisiensis]MPR28878.1 flagellar hook-associated family protein [Microvirga tunisiensis]